MIDAEFKTLMRNIKHGKDLVASLSELHATGQFADVKLVCADGSLWSHRPLLAAVSPVLHSLLLNSLNDDVVTLILPQLRRVHLKLVLDYVYSGSMYLRATQMQYVIGVIEVISLRFIVAVSISLFHQNNQMHKRRNTINPYFIQFAGLTPQMWCIRQ